MKAEESYCMKSKSRIKTLRISFPLLSQCPLKTTQTETGSNHHCKGSNSLPAFCAAQSHYLNYNL